MDAHFLPIVSLSKQNVSIVLSFLEKYFLLLSCLTLFLLDNYKFLTVPLIFGTRNLHFHIIPGNPVHGYSDIVASRLSLKKFNSPSALCTSGDWTAFVKVVSILLYLQYEYYTILAFLTTKSCHNVILIIFCYSAII